MKDTSFYKNFEIRCKGELYKFERPIVMGIINATPDSFYASSRTQVKEDILSSAEKMLLDGAKILDIGAYSSRPGAENISVEEEKKRLLPAIEWIRSKFPDTLLSVDTFRAEIAEAALNLGVEIINDISGGQLDMAMHQVVGDFDAAYILMHMKGNPQTMASLTDYQDMLGEINSFFNVQIQSAQQAGIQTIILDPGFGFSKTIVQNFELLKNLDAFHSFNFPILAGVSRKSMIWKSLGSSPELALNGTSVLNTIALLKGASLLRVHDVKEAMEAIRLVELTQNS